MLLKRKNYQKSWVMVFCTTLATFSLLNTINHKVGLLKNIYILILVCIVTSTILLVGAASKDNNKE
jgi:hypothetical protein